jgi:formate hydrogenlyase transcriptional activator
VLRRLVEGTAPATGEEFFQTLVRNLGMALESSYSFIAEFAEVSTRVRTLALWGNGRLLENIEYDLAGTPCEDVARGRVCHHARGVQEEFPEDRLLAEMGVESYFGVPLLDGSGRVLGHLAVLDTAPMRDEPRRLSIFEIFAARAAAELERMRAEELLRASEKRFRACWPTTSSASTRRRSGDASNR